MKKILIFLFCFFLFTQNLFASFETELPYHITITNFADLPAAVGGTITLADNTYYKFGGDGSPIILTDNLVVGSGSRIFNATITTSGTITFTAGGAFADTKLTYTGTGTFINSANTTPGAVVRLQDTRISATNATYFSASSTQPAFFVLETIALIGSGNTLGSFSGYSVSWRGISGQFAGQFAAGATFSNNSLITIDSIEIPNGFSAPTTVLNFTGTGQGSIQLEKVNINNSGTNVYAYKFDTATTFNSQVNVHAGLVTDQAKAFAASSYDYKTVGFIFNGVGNIPDSTSEVNSYFTGGAATTTGSATPTKVNATWGQRAIQRFTENTNGRWTYNGLATSEFEVYAEIEADPTSGAATGWSLFIAKNGTVIQPAFEIPIGVGLVSKVESTTITTSLATNDYIEVYLARDSGAGDAVVTKGNINITQK